MNLTDLLKENERKYLINKSLSKGEILFHENDVCKSLGIVTKGQLKITTFLENGKEIIYRDLKKDDVFGNNLLFSSEPLYKGDIIAVNDASVFLIFHDDLLKILEENLPFLTEYLKIQSDSTKKLNSRIKLLSFANARERLIYYFHECKNTIEYETISELADRLFLTRETLSRLISKMEKENSIIRTDKTIRLL